jgi:putative redox protein
MTVRSQTETSGKMRQVVSVDAHTLYADVGVDSGGEDSAPGPHDLFDASLATCKALTACIYAKRKGFLLDRVEVEVTRDDTEERKGTYKLGVQLRFFGGLSDGDRQQIWDAVMRCPIHKLMTTTEVVIEQAPLG